MPAGLKHCGALSIGVHDHDGAQGYTHRAGTCYRMKNTQIIVAAAKSISVRPGLPPKPKSEVLRMFFSIEVIEPRGGCYLNHENQRGSKPSPSLSHATRAASRRICKSNRIPRRS